MVYRSCSRAIPWVALLVAVACGGSGTQSGLSPNASTGSGVGGSGASTGEVGTGSGVSAATGSADMAPGSGASSGNTTPSGSTTGAVGSGVSSGAGAAGSTGTAGGSATSGAAGTGATSGAASSGAVIAGHTGPSPGCGMAPVGAVSATFTNHKLPIPACTGCSAAMANCPRDCIAPEFAPGGASSETAKNGEDFTNRDFSIALPSNYQTGTPYPIYMGGSGCGGSPPQVGDGYGISGDNNALRVGLSYIGQCFADGGIQCTGSIATEPLCKNGPEIPYIRAVLKWVESNFCVDMGKEFIGGGSSGGWESMTAGCGDADQLRGFVSVSGGLRVNQWPCTGPMAALMVVNAGDDPNPVGPLAKISLDLDSFGSAPERDSLLMRNGCTGTATTMYSTGFPACLKYTGCPDKYPVIWCELNGGHDNTMQGVDYKNVMWSFLTSLP